MTANDIFPSEYTMALANIGKNSYLCEYKDTGPGGS